MVCDICNKNQATVHLTEIIDDQITELHLCEKCARQKSAEMEEHFGLADLLSGLVDMGPAVVDEEEIKVKCPNCGMKYSDFKKIGRLGCGECYNTFRKAMLPLLKRIHGSSQHYGKAPTKIKKAVVKTKTEIEDLKAQLQKAIQMEAFEEAARLRDKIKELENKPD